MAGTLCIVLANMQFATSVRLTQSITGHRKLNTNLHRFRRVAFILIHEVLSNCLTLDSSTSTRLDTSVNPHYIRKSTLNFTKSRCILKSSQFRTEHVPKSINLTKKTNFKGKASSYQSTNGLKL